MKRKTYIQTEPKKTMFFAMVGQDKDKHQAPNEDIFTATVKPVLSSHLKIGKTKVLMENCILMKVASILQYF